MRQLLTRVGVLTAAAITAAVGAAPAAHAAVQPDIRQFNCSISKNFLKLYTRYHGYPACFGDAGTITFGTHPPRDTWTSYGLCPGNKAGIVSYYNNDGSRSTEHFDRYGACIWWTNPPYGNTVEVESITIG